MAWWTLIKPPAPLDPRQRPRPAGDDREPGERITQAPVELRHVLEVHAPDAGQDGRRDADHRHDRPYLEELVLLDVDEAERGVEQQLDLFRQAAFVVAQRRDVLVDRLEAFLRGLG